MYARADLIFLEAENCFRNIGLGRMIESSSYPARIHFAFQSPGFNKPISQNAVSLHFELFPLLSHTLTCQ